MASMLEQEKVHQFLMGLDNKKFNTVRSNILSQEPLPSLNKAYAAVIREERQLQFTQLTEPRKAMEGAASKVASQNRSSSNRPKCSHCQKLGHEQHQCYELVRYPPNWVNRQVIGGSSGSNKRAITPRNLVNGEKNQPSNGQRLAGGANYRGGMINYATETVDRSLSTLNMADKGSHRGSEQSRQECEMGFAGFTPTQVRLFLFSI